jgi:hypothetical protein
MTEVEPEPESASSVSPEGSQDTPGPQDPLGAFDPQALFAALSITDLEGDVDALMDDRMNKLNEMLDGLDQLVARIEGEVDRFEGQVDPPQ